ncbi:MAG: hypothetical protein ACH349_01585 [Candidatus Rhabdochlamydia sp.]
MLKWINKYDLEQLKETFLEDGQDAEKNRLEMIDRFKENYPAQLLPDHMTDSFNLSYALYSICDELSNLKKKA